MKNADFSIGTLIYVIIIIVASIISAVKKRANKTVVSKSDQPDKPVKTWEEILAETLDIPGTAEPMVKTAPVSQHIDNQIIIKKNAGAHRNEHIRSGISDKIQMAPHHEYHSIELVKESEIYKLEKEDRLVSIDFDIRKAIIFSEILNNKYFHY
jgi:hypothetical protein